MNTDTINAIATCYSNLSNIQDLVFRVHDEAYWPLTNSGTTCETKVSASPRGSTPPGRVDRIAVSAYKASCQDVARAYFEAFRLALAGNVEIPTWYGAQSLVPTLTVTPSPSEVARGARVTAIALLLLAKDHGEKLVNAENLSVSFHTNRAHDRLVGVLASNASLSTQRLLAKHREAWQDKQHRN